jgi:hypothetical protein
MPETISSDLNVLVPNEFVCHDKVGNEVKVNKPNWGKEIKISKIIAGFIKSLPADKIDTAGQVKITDILPILFETFPDKITDIVSILMEKEPDYICENFTLKGVAELLIPFFQSYSEVLSKLGNQFVQQTRK